MNKRQSIAFMVVMCSSISMTGILCTIALPSDVILEIFKGFFTLMGVALTGYTVAQSLTDKAKMEGDNGSNR